MSSAHRRNKSGVTHGQRPHAMENRNGNDVVSSCYFSSDLCEYGCCGWVALVVQAAHIATVIVIAHVAGENNAGTGAGGGHSETNLIDGDGSLYDVAEPNYSHTGIIVYNGQVHSPEASCARYFPNC